MTVLWSLTCAADENYFIEAKLYKLTESVPHQTLFQHELGYVCPSV